jgi:hypothetical protein
MQTSYITDSRLHRVYENGPKSVKKNVIIKKKLAYERNYYTRPHFGDIRA